jgi:hypothetical protein
MGICCMTVDIYIFFLLTDYIMVSGDRIYGQHEIAYNVMFRIDIVFV